MTDITLPVDNGFVNLRVGAIIIKDNKLLLAASHHYPYYYTVGGRIKFGESTIEAVKREVYEETGYSMDIDRLGFISEEYYTADGPSYNGKKIYEISFFYYMKTPEDFCPDTSFSASSEYLVWTDMNDCHPMLPAFLVTELINPSMEVKHYINFEK